MDAAVEIADLRRQLREERTARRKLEAELVYFRQARRVHAQRTKEAMRERGEAGEATGRPSVRSARPEVYERIRRERAQGFTYQKIADGLNADGIPTARGAVLWRPSSVRASCP